MSCNWVQRRILSLEARFLAKSKAVAWEIIKLDGDRLDQPTKYEAVR